MLRKWGGRCSRYLWLSAACLIILFAVLLNLARALTPLLEREKGYLEKWASAALHQSVHIGHVRASWRGFEPELQFSDVVVHRASDQQPVIRIQKLAVSINLVESLLKRTLLPGQLSISGTTLTIYQDKLGHFQVLGIPRSSMQNDSNQPSTALRSLLLWLFTQTNLSVSQVDVIWRNAQGVVIPIKNLHLYSSNSGSSREWVGQMFVAQTVPTQVKFILQLHDSKVNLDQLNMDAFIQVKNLLVKQWLENAYLKPHLHGMRFSSGRTNLSVWAQWRKGDLNNIQALVDARRVHVQLPKIPAKNLKRHLVINQLQTNVQWRNYQNGWSVAMDHLRLHVNGVAWPENRMGFRYFASTKNSPAQYLLRFNYLHLQSLQPLAVRLGYWPPIARLWYRKLQPKGELQNIALSYTQTSGSILDQLAHLNLSAQFSNLGFCSVGKLPGIVNLSGQIITSPSGGTLKLQSHNVMINAPTVWKQTKKFTQINATFNSHQGENGIIVYGDHLQLSDGTLQTVSTLRLQIPLKKTTTQLKAQDAEKPDPLQIQLLTEFQLKDIAKVDYYLPDQILHHELNNWLSHAFYKGEGSGTLLLEGPLKDFPFAKREGKFEIITHVKGVDFKFQPDWPMLENTNADLRFFDEGLAIHVKQAQIAGNPVNNINASITDFSHPVLKLAGHIQSELSAGMRFLKASPLNVMEHLGGMQLQGPMDLGLKLRVAFAGKNTQVDSYGVLNTKGASMQLPQWRLALSHISGTLRFHNDQLSTPKMTAQLFGNPVYFTMMPESEPGGNHALQIEVGGRVNLLALQKHYSLPFSQIARGDTDFRGLLQIQEGDKHADNSLSIISDLYGVQINHLPPGYSKTATTREPFRLRIQFNQSQSMLFTLDYNQKISAAFAFAKQGKQSQFQGGEIHLGKGKAKLQGMPHGLSITGNLDKLDWDEWKPFIQYWTGSQQVTSSENMLKRVQLHIGQLFAFNQHLTNAQLELTPAREHYWVAKINSSKISGKLYVPKNSSDVWLGRFERLYISELKTNKTADAQSQSKSISILPKTVDPTKIPPINFDINDFHYGKKQFGHVQSVTTREASGVKINSFTVQSPIFSVHLTGSWLHYLNGTRTTLIGTFDTKDFGQLLQKFDITDRMAAGRGNISYALRWQDAPYQFNKHTLNGKVRVNLEEGRILHISKKTQTELGLAKLLNLFSLQSIARRLTFHFDDLTKQGFPYTVFKGEFKIGQGKAITQDAYVDSTVAKLTIRGDVDYVREHYDLTLGVAPYVTSSLPLIVGIAGGPIAGIATWVVNKLVEPEIGKVAGVMLRITGPWKNPNIQRIHESNGHEHASHDRAPVEHR